MFSMELLQSGPLDNDTWYHLAIVQDKLSTSMYLNSKRVASTLPCDFGVGPGLCWLSRHTSNQAFSGKIDEIRIWSKARSLEELETYAKVRIGGLDLGLLGLYRFLPDTITEGKKVPDLSLAGNSLKFLGGQRVRFCQPMLDWKTVASLEDDDEEEEQEEEQEEKEDDRGHTGGKRAAEEKEEDEGKRDDGDGGRGVVWGLSDEEGEDDVELVAFNADDLSSRGRKARK